MAKHSSQFWRLSSLKQLVLLSFLVVVTPFGILIYYATDALVAQSAQGRVLAQQALEVTRRGQQLEHLAEDITRSLRQYQIVAKPEIRNRLSQFIAEYKDELAIHSFILPGSKTLQTIQTLLSRIDQSEPIKNNSLLSLTRSVNSQIDQILDARIRSLNETAQKTQTQLSMMAVILLSFEAILILFLSHTIIRPVRRLADRIQALGQGETYAGKRVGGPDELVELDKQLDWLTQCLAEVEHEKQRFLRHMSHELKTPLTTLREGSDLLAEQIMGTLNKSQMEIANLLQSNSRQLQTLIEQLLDYSRLSQNEPVTLHPIAILPVIREALEPYKLLLEQKAIALQIPEHDSQCLTDRAMLLRILGNLISNAALYSSKKGTITITVYTQENLFCIEVCNDGPTIPDSDIPHLFKPFYQGQNCRIGPVKGSGIGLSIVHDAAEAIGASVSLVSNQNHQVSFRVEIPHLEDTHRV
ncbi:MAG: hypothetical protein CSA60_02060 [Neptuniibacter caesariensis]|uniref:histidine kinase n=1 Tax=Neptuniibacter caesariensis TaxID=207954 RepID=A0A2G6JR44_NEPCE|nr:MAG: hypothetical protein CSA60_02060 [Neptuniibacter caesariensis]